MYTCIGSDSLVVKRVAVQCCYPGCRQSEETVHETCEESAQDDRNYYSGSSKFSSAYLRELLQLHIKVHLRGKSIETLVDSKYVGPLDS